MARYKTINYNIMEPCVICTRPISNCGVGRASHMRSHVRRGEAIEKTAYPRNEYVATTREEHLAIINQQGREAVEQIRRLNRALGPYRGTPWSINKKEAV